MSIDNKKLYRHFGHLGTKQLITKKKNASPAKKADHVFVDHCRSPPTPTGREQVPHRRLGRRPPFFFPRNQGNCPTMICRPRSVPANQAKSSFFSTAPPTKYTRNRRITIFFRGSDSQRARRSDFVGACVCCFKKVVD